MENEFNLDNYVWFALSSDRLDIASYGFTGYTDMDGEYCMIAKAKDRDGNPIPKKYTFNRKFRKIRVNKRNVKELKHLREHPECEGSPNGKYRIDSDGNKVQYEVWFKEINDEKSASVAVDATARRVEAMNIALELKKDPKELEIMANVMGFKGGGNLSLHKLLEIAENRADEFIEAYNSPDKEMRSLFYRGTREGIIKKKAALYMLEGHSLGVDHEECIATLLKNVSIVRLLKRKLGIELEEVSEPESKPKSGRPKKA